MNQPQSKIIKLQSANELRRTMDCYFARLKEAVDTRNKKIAWCTSVGPAELLYSMGFEVYFPENHGAMLGASKTADKYIPTAVAHGYSPEICSYLTSDIGAFLQNETPLQKSGFKSVPKPDILVYNTNQCHEVGDWFMYYAKHFNVPVLGVNTPLWISELTPSIINSVANQFKDLVPELEKVSEQKFDLEKFRETVRLSHDGCVLWRKVLETAMHKPSPINFFDSAIHMGPIVVMRGTQYAVDYYKILLAELQERIKNNIGAVPSEKLRIYWDGMPLWYKLSSMAKLFASLDTCIVASTYCNSWIFDDLDPKDTFQSSALAYCKLFIVRSDEEKQKVLEKLMVDFSIDGIIYHDAKTCSRNSNNRFGLPNRLNSKNNIPYLEINGDLCDSRCYSEEQSIIAIETFIEQLSTRKQ
ncbi:MAG: 2-hydroxyacyl-CoA dehydratase [Bacteroidetes bacterium CG_4_10_14_3_um_filter_31_20]|nr:MAG: 2-hydroxyacyl-CoA dehydratase [Bacteroidetes bacterium CG_4_8_14_3_um_filter_31_14]PIY02414.1 MAG: 2-hydroxyacyl-CoA dehydratase [Bacteroidetes bacterium CG_4_10_14_3_um_filter_31_20]